MIAMTSLRRWCSIGALFLAAVSPASARWVALGGPAQPLIDLQLDPGRPELLYARVIVSEDGREGFLWRSEDGGATWRNIQNGLEQTSVALGIDPSDPRVIWVWTAGGELWRSGDAGDTWARRFVLAPDDRTSTVRQLLIDPRHPSTLYRVGVDDEVRVAVSYDGGATFRKGAPLTHSYFPAVVQVRRGELVAFVAEQGLLVSTDGGQTWSLRSRYRDEGFQGGVVAPSAPGTLYGVPYSEACLARSDDAGAHWRRLGYPRLLGPISGCFVTVDPQDDRHIWAGGGVLRSFDFVFAESRDGGETWSGRLSFSKGDMGLNLIAIGGSVLITGSRTSTDGGRTWARQDRGISAGDARSGLVAQTLPGNNDSSLRLLALNSTPYSGIDGLYRSHGGRSWRRFPFDSYSVVDAGAPTVVATSSKGLIRSQDGGDSWRAVPSAPDLFSLHSDLNQPRHLIAHTFENGDPIGDVFVWLSDDAGATWRKAPEELTLSCTHQSSVDICFEYIAYAVDPFNSTRRWLAANSYFFSPDPPPLFVTTDAGASWHAVSSLPFQMIALAADPKAKDRLLAATSDGLKVSEDGGEHWRNLGNGFPDGAVIDHLAYDPRIAAWYAATSEHGIYRSVDGGANWALLPGAPDREGPTIAIDPRTPGALLAAFRGQGVWLWTP